MRAAKVARDCGRAVTDRVLGIDRVRGGEAKMGVVEAPRSVRVVESRRI